MTLTDELLADAAALTAIASQAFSEEVMFMTEDAIFEGTGAGQPLGVINSPALISIAAETGQAAGTIVKENIDKMYQAVWGRSRKNMVWLYNQDCESQLAALNGAVGTGGELVYMPPGGISAAPYATLKGRPIIPTEYNAALGTLGDPHRGRSQPVHDRRQERGADGDIDAHRLRHRRDALPRDLSRRRQADVVEVAGAVQGLHQPFAVRRDRGSADLASFFAIRSGARGLQRLRAFSFA
jgi:hypothetical protein